MDRVSGSAAHSMIEDPRAIQASGPKNRILAKETQADSRQTGNDERQAGTTESGENRSQDASVFCDSLALHGHVSTLTPHNRRAFQHLS